MEQWTQYREQVSQLATPQLIDALVREAQMRELAEEKVQLYEAFVQAGYRLVLPGFRLAYVIALLTPVALCLLLWYTRPTAPAPATVMVPVVAPAAPAVVAPVAAPVVAPAAPAPAKAKKKAKVIDDELLDGEVKPAAKAKQ